MKINKMVQYGVWPNCCNNCKFCLRLQRIPYDKNKQLLQLERIKKNIDIIDWKNQYSFGISLLGGQLYYITDNDLQQSFLQLIDIIIEKILKVSNNPQCKYSTVTNGIYNPQFLYKVIDKIVNQVGIDKVDLNFSYDLKYRYSTEKDRLCVLKNINQFHNRYNYIVGVQMILTQYLIDLWKNDQFNVKDFTNKNFSGNKLVFLYPHPIQTSYQLQDFKFKRKDFLNFITQLKIQSYDTYVSFLLSTKNSCSFKYTGLHDKTRIDANQLPKLTENKQIFNKKCGHSVLYQCYSDTNKCILCDLYNLDKGIYL